MVLLDDLQDDLGLLDVISCPGCGKQVGQVVAIDSLPWLSVNGIAVRSMHGVCLSCGEEFHWSTNERMLAELIAKVLNHRNKML